MKIYQKAVQRKITFLMLFAAIVGFGIVSLFQLQPDLLPDISFPAITVMQTYPGVGPEEMESLITRRIEQGVSSVDRARNVSSNVREGISLTTVEFEWGTDMDFAAIDVREAMDRVQAQLPDDADSPFIFKFDFSMMPIMMLALSGPLERSEIRQIAGDIAEPRIESVEGVAAADTRGGAEREIQVELDRMRLESYGIHMDSVISAIRADNINRPGGAIKTSTMEYLLRTSNAFRNIRDMEDIVVDVRGGASVYLSDVSSVRDGFAEPTNEMTLNGEPAVMLIVQRQSGANTVEVARNVRSVLSEIERELPRGMEFTVVMDTSEFIEQAVTNLANVALQGGVFAIIVLLFFLGNIRATLIVALTIPISIIASFSALRAGGITLNVMSLGGLALAVGMLVDNSVVVLENIFRHREEGQTASEGAVWGTDEVAMPIAASTLTTIAVFLPIFFVPGIAGILFREQALTVTLSLAVSLLVALSLIPLLSSILFKKPFNEEKKSGMAYVLKEKIKSLLARLEESYAFALKWVLEHKKTVVFTVASVFIFSIAVVFPLRWVPAEFMPRVDEGQLNINIELPVGTRLEETMRKTTEIEEIVTGEVDEIRHIRSRIGPGGFVFGGREGSHTSQVGVELVPASDRRRSQDEITAALRRKLADITGARIRISGGGGGMRIMGGAASPIEVEIYGYELEAGRKIAEDIKNIIEDTPGATDVEIGISDPRMEYSIKTDRKKAGSMGFSVAEVANQIETYVLGRTIGYFRAGEDEYPIRIRLREEDRQNLSQIEKLPVVSRTGNIISLNTIADVSPSAGPVSITRLRQRRMITVSADYTGSDLAGISSQIEERITEKGLPDGFTFSMGGDVQEQRETFFWLALAFLGAVVLVYMVMASQFESLLDPLIILFTIPLALVGVIWMLFFTGTSISVISLIGVIMLVGIVVNNSIVLIDYINLLRARGLDLKEAIITGGRKRLRPVLTTAMTTMLAMTPMALGLGEGAEMSFPIARSLIGGLIAATFLTLLVIPVIYAIFESSLRKNGGKH